MTYLWLEEQAVWDSKLPRPRQFERYFFAKNKHCKIVLFNFLQKLMTSKIIMYLGRFTEFFLVESCRKLRPKIHVNIFLWDYILARHFCNRALQYLDELLRNRSHMHDVEVSCRTEMRRNVKKLFIVGKNGKLFIYFDVGHRWLKI